MYDLYILTTAIDRSDLHNQTLPPFFKILEDQGISYKWFINLDSPFKKTEEATNNLKSLYVNNENINKHTSKEGMFNASDRASPRGIKTKTEKSSILPNYGIDIKHNSYDRYLARKKSQYIKTELQDVNLKPKYGNKTFKLGIVRSNSCIKNC